MLFERKDGLFVCRFGHLLVRRRVVHGFSTRKGGVSPAPCDSLNLGLNTDDAVDRVRQNRRRFFTAVQQDEDGTVIPVQVHGDRVRAVESPGSVPDTDAVVTDRTGLVLSVQVADCLSIFLLDPVKPAIGLIHAGWRGTAKSIARKTVQKLCDAFGGNPRDILAFIGPSIGPCCYVVGEATATSFDAKYLINGKLDLWQGNEDQLVDAGLKKENIVHSRICTACHPEWFYSHRKSGGKTGRMLAVLGIRE